MRNNKGITGGDPVETPIGRRSTKIKASISKKYKKKLYVFK